MHTRRPERVRSGGSPPSDRRQDYAPRRTAQSVFHTDALLAATTTRTARTRAARLHASPGHATTPLGSTHGRADDCANPLVSLPQGQLQRPRARPRGRRHGRRGGDFSTVGSRIGRASFGTTRLITGPSRCRRQTRNSMAADSHCAAMRRSRRPNRMPGGGHRESKVGRYCNRRSCSHGK
jgi:hypothetical protein